MKTKGQAFVQEPTPLKEPQVEDQQIHMCCCMYALKIDGFCKP